MPGSGKSTIGRFFSRAHSFDFVDLDALLVEKKLFMPIADFFRSEGEEKFRNLESQGLSELTPVGRDLVVATGGGIVLRPDNRDYLKNNGLVFYLSSKPDSLFKRLRNDVSRPLLRVADPLLELQRLYETRHPLYMSVADHVIDANNRTVSDISSEISRLYY